MSTRWPHHARLCVTVKSALLQVPFLRGCREAQFAGDRLMTSQPNALNIRAAALSASDAMLLHGVDMSDIMR